MSYLAVKEENCLTFFGRRTVVGTVVVAEFAEPLVVACCVACRLKSKEMAKDRFFNPFVLGQPMQPIWSPATERIIPSAFPRKVATLPLTDCVKAPRLIAKPNSSGTLGSETRSVEPVPGAVEPICLSTRDWSQRLRIWEGMTSS